ncbi:hypothetical protein MKX53_13155 [Psychrobacillus sp. FSL K6-4615]|uniref:hypothetical protein n=1 Tax=Psychrobacillus sp. FSL K6-4615 TaxID=2921551 RepID=UPI0030FB2910
MSKIFTKISSLALAAAVVGSGLSVNVNAAELEKKVPDSIELKNAVVSETQENVGVNEVGAGVGDPNVIVPYDVSKPTSTWNLSTDGRYPISGKSSMATLYSNYLFTGVSSFTINIRNYHNTSLKVKLKRKDAILDNTLETYIVKPFSSWQDDLNVSWSVNSSSKYYLEFEGPSEFSGSIQKN